MSREIPDSQVDLCGEIGRGEDESFPLLAPEDIFEFACNGCGGCFELRIGIGHQVRG